MSILLGKDAWSAAPPITDERRPAPRGGAVVRAQSPCMSPDVTAP